MIMKKWLLLILLIQPTIFVHKSSMHIESKINFLMAERMEVDSILHPIIIVIDPGHGPLVDNSVEPIAPGSKIMKRSYGIGAVGNVLGLMEREVNLNVSLMLKDHLIAAGYQVVMTREDHITIATNIDRVNIANELHANLMIRVHNDSSTNTSRHGASILVPDEVGYAKAINEISYAYGEIILNTLTEEVGMKNNGVVIRDDQTGFNWSRVPIMTIEMGFLSNAKEEALLAQEDYQQKLALALFKGIEKVFIE